LQSHGAPDWRLWVGDGGDDTAGGTGYAAVGQIGAQVDSAKARLGGNIDAPDAVGDDDGNDDDWSVDVSEEAVRQRTMDLGTGVTSLTQTDDLERTVEERLVIFQNYVKARLGEAKFPAKDVIGEADRLECKDKGVMVVVELLLSKADDVFVAIKKYQGLFQRFTLENEKCQKYMIGALEVLIDQNPDLLGKAARLFKDLYDKDILDEEIILAWGAKASKKYVTKELATQIRDKCKPFLEWLAEAEEEESDEDESMVFAANPEAVIAAEAAKKAEEEAAANPPKEDENEDPESEDLDDDDIENM